MSDKNLKHFLSQQAERTIPEDVDLRTAIYRRIPLKNTTQPKLRLSRAAIIILVVLAFATGAYAFYQSTLRPDPGIKAAQNDNLVVQINQTHALDKLPKTLQSLAITVDYAYADSNRITIGYHVSGEAKAGDAIQLFTNPTLTDAAGNQYGWIPATGQQTSTASDGASDPAAIVPLRVDGEMSFDSSSLETAPASLNLNLRIEVAFSTADMRAGGGFDMGLAGDTHFQFQIPFNPGRTVAVNQSATAGGITLDVKKAVIAPSLTRLEFCAASKPFISTPDHWLDWKASVSVDVGGQLVEETSDASFGSAAGQPLSADAVCRSLVIPDQFTQYSGMWTVTINAFDNTGTGEHLAGPWVFSFSS